MSFEEADRYGWIRPLVYAAGALGTVVAAVAGFNSYEPEAPSSDMQARLYKLEGWRDHHQREIDLRWSEADRDRSGLREEVAELRRRVDQLMMERRSAGTSGAKIVEEIHP